jgi:MFS family permease
MISATYALSGLLLALSTALFAADVLSAASLTLAWTVVFFFASAAASSAYLTVGESFPLELRALAIALFYALGTLFGGAASPWLFGVLIENGGRSGVLGGYLIGAALMLVAAAVELRLGIGAERRPLEEVAAPLSLHRDIDPSER